MIHRSSRWAEFEVNFIRGGPTIMSVMSRWWAKMAGGPDWRLQGHDRYLKGVWSCRPALRPCATIRRAVLLSRELSNQTMLTSGVVVLMLRSASLMGSMLIELIGYQVTTRQAWTRGWHGLGLHDWILLIRSLNLSSESSVNWCCVAGKMVWRIGGLRSSTNRQREQCRITMRGAEAAIINRNSRNRLRHFIPSGTCESIVDSACLCVIH